MVGTKSPYSEYVVVGRHVPTEKDPKPKVYRMRIFARNAIFAKSRFWYFASAQKKIKRASGEILTCNKVLEKKPATIKNFGVFMRYSSKTGTHNLYKEYRDLTRAGAIQQVYQDLAGTYRARFRNVQIISIDAVPSNKTRRPNVKQFHDNHIKFPLPQRVLKTPRKYRSTFSRTKPQTLIA